MTVPTRPDTTAPDDGAGILAAGAAFTAATELAAAVAGVYRQAETATLQAVTRRLGIGLDDDQAPDVWQRRKLGELPSLRRPVAQIVHDVDRTGPAEIRTAIMAGYQAGRVNAAAAADRAQLSGRARRSRAGTAARINALGLQRLVDAATREVRPVHAAILPATLDAYRKTIAAAAARKLAGEATLRDACQSAWAALTSQGITRFVDTAGRHWRLHTYVEMAMRAAVTRAVVHGIADQCLADGVRLVSVDDVPGECERCRPFEHRVLALTGPPGVQEVRHARDPDAAPVTVDVVATLDEAMLAGLFHPGCRHSLRPYFPGVSMLIKQGRTADPRGYEDRQRQRAIERALRHWREQADAALTPQARRRAEARVAGWDAEMGDHIAATGLTRLRYRETIGAGFVPPPGQVADAARLLGIPAPD